MNTEKLKQNYSLWNTVDKLYTVSSDVIFALCINYKNQLEYSTFYVNGGNNILSKCWQYEFGLTAGMIQFNPHIFYWKYLKDINFTEVQWKDIKVIPDKNKQIIAWVNKSDYVESNKTFVTYELTTLQTRLHFGYFNKHWYGKRVEYQHYTSIPWKKVFRWCYVDDLFINDINEDARNFPISPDSSINNEFIQKQYS